jgi:hypothetical protein
MLVLEVSANSFGKTTSPLAEKVVVEDESGSERGKRLSFKALVKKASLRRLSKRVSRNDSDDTLEMMAGGNPTKANIKRRQIRFDTRPEVYKYPKVQKVERGACWWTGPELLELRNETREERMIDSNLHDYMINYLTAHKQVCRLSKISTSSLDNLISGAKAGYRGMDLFCSQISDPRKKRCEQIIQSTIYAYEEQLYTTGAVDVNELRGLSLSLTASSRQWAIAIAKADQQAVE